MRWVAYPLIVAISGLACTTRKPVPCAPDIRWQDRVEKVSCIIQIADLPAVELPQYPPFDEADPAAWAKEVRRVAKERERIYEDYIRAYRMKLSEHNRLEPKCSD